MPEEPLEVPPPDEPPDMPLDEPPDVPPEEPPEVPPDPDEPLDMLLPPELLPLDPVPG